jgi:Zn-dependent protease with chaperone function
MGRLQGQEQTGKSALPSLRSETLFLIPATMRALLIALLLLLPLIAAAQSPSPQVTVPKAATATPSPAPAGPVAVPEPDERTMSYYRSGIVLFVVNFCWGLLVPALFLFTGWSAGIRRFAERIGRNWFFTIGFYFVIFSLLTFIIDFPLSYYESFVREHQYELSNQTFGKWLSDEFKGLCVGLIGGFLFLWVPYLLLRRSPRWWWLYTSLLAVPFLILTILIEPVWIDPLFNKFGPMKDKALEAKILSLAERAGIEGSRVYEVAKSEDTKALNAYVNGFGATKRIVLWDTTLQKLGDQEILFVMGHEMGHYVLGHVWQGILFFSLLILLTLLAIHLTAGWLIGRFRARFGFEQLSDIASLPLLMLLFGLYLFIVTPVALAFTRHQEHEADRFGLEITQNSHAAATAFVKLQTENLSNPRPGPLVKIMTASHPPLGERIDFANTYRPWENNAPLIYGHLFHTPKQQSKVQP